MREWTCTKIKILLFFKLVGVLISHFSFLISHFSFLSCFSTIITKRRSKRIYGEIEYRILGSMSGNEVCLTMEKRSKVLILSFPSQVDFLGLSM